MKKIAINAVLAIGAFFVILPFIWMLSLSVKPENEIYAPTLTLLPQVWDWANYAEAYVQGEMRLFIRNGLIVTVCILAIQCLTVIPTAYVLARKHFRLQRAMFLLVLSALLIPPQVVAIPLFLVNSISWIRSLSLSSHFRQVRSGSFFCDKAFKEYLKI